MESALTFNDSMTFGEWKGFGKKQVARTYETYVVGFEQVKARLTTLEELKPVDEGMFAVATVTAPEQRIATT